MTRGGIQLDKAFAKVRGIVECAIAGGDVDVALIIRGRRAPCLPDGSAPSVTRSQKSVNLLLHVGRVVPHEPPVKHGNISVRPEPGVDNMIQQQEPRALQVLFG